MTEQDYGFSFRRRGTHRLAGRTILQMVGSLDDLRLDRAALDVAAAAAEAGARPLVAAPPGPLVSELQAVGGVWVDFPSATRNPLTMVLASRRLRALVADEGVDLIHARTTAAAWIAQGTARKASIPFVTSLTALLPGQSALRLRDLSVMARGDAVVAGSRFAAATITSLYPAAAGHVRVIRPGVDLTPFKAATIDAARVQTLRRAWAVAPEARILLLFARPSVWKGHKVLVEAVRRLVEAGTADMKLVLIGEGRGGFEREIDSLVKTAGLSSMVHRTPHCDDMPAALLAASVVVVPSIEAESFGRVAIEAQAAGTPVVVSDLGALPETVLAPPDVEPGKRTGWRVSPSDPILLAEALAAALSLGASSRDALAQRARRQAEERFSIARMAQESLDLYADQLDFHAERSG